jgi:hypothetical protein
MPNHVELEEFLSPGRVEEAHRQAILQQERGNQSFANTGWRAAEARDDRLLKVLEKSSEIIDKIQEQQLGRTMRGVSTTFAESKGTTEAQMWREAYRLCDEGNPIRNFEWIYGAAAWLAGYNV